MSVKVETAVRISDVGALQPGDGIEAVHHGIHWHYGTITELIPALGLLWIMDRRTGTCKLLDIET